MLAVVFVFVFLIVSFLFFSFLCVFFLFVSFLFFFVLFFCLLFSFFLFCCDWNFIAIISLQGIRFIGLRQEAAVREDHGKRLFVKSSRREASFNRLGGKLGSKARSGKLSLNFEELTAGGCFNWLGGKLISKRPFGGRLILEGAWREPRFKRHLAES